MYSYLLVSKIPALKLCNLLPLPRSPTLPLCSSSLCRTLVPQLLCSSALAGHTFQGDTDQQRLTACNTHQWLHFHSAYAKFPIPKSICFCGFFVTTASCLLGMLAQNQLQTGYTKHSRENAIKGLFTETILPSEKFCLLDAQTP